MAVCNQEALRAFAALRGANPGPPFLAAAKLASTKASFSSSSLAHPSSSMSAIRMRSQVPSSAHRVSHRWQVERDGYRSGRSFHGAPVRSTQRMPLMTWRRSASGRPLPSSRRFSSGRSGASFVHCFSVRSTDGLHSTPDARWKAVSKDGAISIAYDLAGFWDGL